MHLFVQHAFVQLRPTSPLSEPEYSSLTISLSSLLSPSLRDSTSPLTLMKLWDLLRIFNQACLYESPYLREEGEDTVGHRKHRPLPGPVYQGGEHPHGPLQGAGHQGAGVLTVMGEDN